MNLTPGGGGVLPYMGYMGMCRCEGYGFQAVYSSTGKNNGFPLLDIFGYLKNTHKNPKFGKVRLVPTREFPTKFPDWDLSHSSKFGIFVGIL